VAQDNAAGVNESPATLSLVDTHCHLDFDALAADIDDVLRRAAEAGVGRIIVPALDLANVRTVLNLTKQHDNLFAAVGIHPNSAMAWQDEWIDELHALARRARVVAIGEIGLDYYWDEAPVEIQHRALALQLELAAELDLPVIIHNRDAANDVLRMLAASSLAGRERPGVLHSFSADWVAAESALALGYYLGFTGPITFKKADELRDIAARAPLDRILIETDAPFLTPHPFRGRRNEPAYVRYVAEKLAEVRGLSLEEVARATTANAERLFRLSPDSERALAGGPTRGDAPRRS